MANYKMIDGVVVGDLDQCFKRIQQMAAEQGETLGYEFNGNIITSDMSIDDVYSTVIGLTKTEYDKEMAEYRAQQEREKLSFEEKKPQLAMDYKARGAALVPGDQIADWNTFVDMSLNDLYRGADCVATLELLDAIHNGSSAEQIKDIFERQGHSGVSANRTASMVEKFSGKENIRSYLLNMDERKPTLGQDSPEAQQENKPDKATELKERGKAVVAPEKLEKWNEAVDRSLAGWTKGLEIENALELMEAIERGADLDELRGVINSQGHSGLGASLVGNTVEGFSKHGDGMYHFIVNNDPSGLDTFVNPPENTKELSREEMAADLKARGNAIVNPATANDEHNWDWYVDKCMGDIYEGFDAQCTVEILEAMARGESLDEIAQKFDDQNHSGASAGIVSSAVEHFAVNGGGMQAFLFSRETDGLEYQGGSGLDDQNGLDEQDIDTQEIGE